MGPSAVGRKPARLSAVAALACLVSSAGWHPPPGRSVASEGAGAGRTWSQWDFEATYKVSGQLAIFPGPNGRSTLPTRPGPVSDPFITKGAVWSFFMHAVDGYQLQWIENGQHFEDCWTMPTRPGWHCGQGTYEASNGFSMATLPTSSDGLHGPAAGRAGRATGKPAPDSFPADTSAFGRLTCLTSVSAAAADLPGGPPPGTRSRPLLHRPWPRREPAPVG